MVGRAPGEPRSLPHFATLDEVESSIIIEIMKFACRISEKAGLWTAEHSSQDVGPIRVTASTRAEVLQKIEGEIRYWLEMCPCSGQASRKLEIELVDSG
jgi:hypothetical protein